MFDEVNNKAIFSKPELFFRVPCRRQAGLGRLAAKRRGLPRVGKASACPTNSARFESCLLKKHILISDLKLKYIFWFLWKQNGQKILSQKVSTNSATEFYFKKLLF